MVRGKGYLEGLFNQFSKKIHLLNPLEQPTIEVVWGATLVELKK